MLKIGDKKKAMGRGVAVPFDEKARGVSVTLLQSWLTCRKKALLKLQGWKVIRPSQALTYGSMAHEIIASAFSKLDAPPKKAWIEKELDRVLKKSQEELGRVIPAETQQMLERCAGMLSAILPVYFDYYKEDFEKLSWEKIEAAFDYHHEGLGMRMVGVYDALFRLKGKLWLKETKTSSQIDEDSMIELLHYDFQLGFYLLSLFRQTKELPKGVIYDILRKPSLKQGVKETLVQFLNRIREDVAARKDFYFVRFEVAVSKKEIEDFERELVGILSDFKRWVSGDVPTYRNTTACKNRWGLCECVPICARADYSGFIQRHHTPKGGK